MQLNSCSGHQPFFVKCPTMPQFLLLPFDLCCKPDRKGGWATCGLGESYRCADGVEHPAVSGGARYIISLFPLMTPSSESSGLEKPDPCKVSSPLHGAGEGDVFLARFFSLHGAGESEKALTQMCKCRQSGCHQRACLVLPVPCHGCWNVVASCHRRVNMTCV